MCLNAVTMEKCIHDVDRRIDRYLELEKIYDGLNRKDSRKF